MSTPCIRIFRPEDLKRLMALERRCFGRDAWPAELFRWHAQTGPGLFFVVEMGTSLAGYSITTLHREFAELASVAVSARWRGQGIGRALIERSIEVSRKVGARGMWLTVRVDNAAAIGLYRSMGFRRMRRVKGYYEDGGDGVRMLVRWG